jgi:methionyl-tRNA formyltransferase
VRIVFWGTPEFAVPALRALMGEGHDVVAVVTQPDRPAGRGRKLRASPVKSVALEEGVPVLTPERPHGDDFLESLRSFDPEVSVVAAYGHILRPEVLELPAHGSINIHASLLPELRGAAPINRAIARGARRSGITVMQMTEGMDEGPILLQREEAITEDDTATSLYLKLSELGAIAIIEALALLEVGAIRPVEQDHDRATYAPKISRDVARIDWTREAREVSNHIRGMDRVPGAWTVLGEEAVKLFRPVVVSSSEPSAPPGTILSFDPSEGILVSTGRGSVLIQEVQPAGKRRMSVQDWWNGAEVSEGSRFR